MKQLIFAAAIVLLPTLSLAETCPTNKPVGRALDKLHMQLLAAPTPQVAQVVTQALWQQWLKAPDGLAQDMLNTGMALRLEMDLAGADRALTQLVEYCPDYAEGHNQRAFVRYLSGQFERALPDLARAIALRPRHLGALSGKGLTHMALGQMDDARVEFAKVVALNPWSPEKQYLREPGEEL